MAPPSPLHRQPLTTWAQIIEAALERCPTSPAMSGEDEWGGGWDEKAVSADPLRDYCRMLTAAEEEAIFQAMEADMSRVEACAEELARAYPMAHAMI